ncbi:condensation domain-containing protein, partial [Peribacillus simplex]|uniref:condensation domain-containing protein n=1 Tax=Peribacillus simplex TaxID=1478 RepID=UPI003D290F28
QQPTIKELANYIDRAEKETYVSIPKVGVQEDYAASSAQQRLYVMSQMDVDSLHYNMPMAMRIEGSLDPRRLEEAFQGLIARHESFRTRFYMKDGQLRQRVEEEVSFSFPVTTCTTSEIEEKIQQFPQPFDLSVAPLLRVEVLRVSEEHNVLLMDMHHIISDGASMKIVFEDLIRLYENLPLPALHLQYKDYASWQREGMGSESFQKQEAYWLDQFKDEIPVLELPTDYNRPAVQRFEGDHHTFKLDEELTQGLRELMKTEGTTLYTTLLSAYNVLLHKYTGQEDIIVGSPIAGRTHADLDEVVGM